ncbi:hypothetical protein LDENG_00123590 [Lucifuga dentata]|nr:hypothetical protein LDENG_00123590 [Lucifuga dentata]
MHFCISKTMFLGLWDNVNGGVFSACFVVDKVKRSLQDLQRMLSFPPYSRDYLHPVVYACTAVMLLCLLVSIITYVLHHRVIRISRKGWHTLLNVLFHTGLTFGVFAAGINQISFPFLCQIVGIVLHYASLSTMLWLTFAARNICSDASRDVLQADRTVQTQPEPTVIKLYLISDGVPLIIVGVTAAFGLDNYGSRDETFCWMSWEPSLGGLYVPATLTVSIMSGYFLRTYIQLKRHPDRKYELQLLSEDQHHHHHFHSQTEAGNSPSFGVSVLANEHSFKSQLRATAFTVFLFLAAWAFGALAVSLGDFLDMIFSCLYGAFCVTLGLFLLIHHCAKRDDVWHHWWACCSSKSAPEDGKGQMRRRELHQPSCRLSSPCSGKQPLLTPQLLQTPRGGHKIPVSPQSPTPTHTGPCCVTTGSVESVPSPCPQSLPEDLPRPVLPLKSCLLDRTKSQSFNHQQPFLEEHRAHKMSSSMDGTVHSSHLDSPHPVHPVHPVHPDLQPPRPSPHLDKQQTSCHSVQDPLNSYYNHTHNTHDKIASHHGPFTPSRVLHTCQWQRYSTEAEHCGKSDPFTTQHQQGPGTFSGSSNMMDKDGENILYVQEEQSGFPSNTLPRQHTTVSRRGLIGRNWSLQEDSLYGSGTRGNVRTGPWKNETSV